MTMVKSNGWPLIVIVTCASQLLSCRPRCRRTVGQSKTLLLFGGFPIRPFVVFAARYGAVSPLVPGENWVTALHAFVGRFAPVNGYVKPGDSTADRARGGDGFAL